MAKHVVAVLQCYRASLYPGGSISQRDVGAKWGAHTPPKTTQGFISEILCMQDCNAIGGSGPPMVLYSSEMSRHGSAFVKSDAIYLSYFSF